MGRNSGNKIIAIEPEINNYHLLEKNIELNHLNNVVALNKGVFSASGTLPFYVVGKWEGGHSVTKRGDDWTETTIEVNTLDNMIDGLNVKDPVNLIKIDIEGAEAHAIKGALGIIEKDHPKLLIEILKENIKNLDEITNMLKPFNYREIISLDENNYFFN